MDCDARKALIPATGENVGHSNTGVLYHLHRCKSLHFPALAHDDKELSTTGKKDQTHVLRIKEGMMIHRAGDEGLKSRPEVRDEVSGDAMDQAILR